MTTRSALILRQAPPHGRDQRGAPGRAHMHGRIPFLRLHARHEWTSGGGNPVPWYKRKWGGQRGNSDTKSDSPPPCAAASELVLIPSHLRPSLYRLASDFASAFARFLWVGFILRSWNERGDLLDRSKYMIPAWNFIDRLVGEQLTRILICELCSLFIVDSWAPRSAQSCMYAVHVVFFFYLVTTRGMNHSCQKFGSIGSRNGVEGRGSSSEGTRVDEEYTYPVRQFGTRVGIHFILGRCVRVDEMAERNIPPKL
jgi:hypothetical protein